MSENLNQGGNPENTGGSQNNPEQNPEDFQQVKQRLADLEAALNKERSIKQQVIQERDQLKKQKKTENNEDVQKLLLDSQTRATELLERVKNTDIKTALVQELTKSGVAPKWFEAAVKLADRGNIDWTEEHGVDSISLQASVARLRKDFPDMFERKLTEVEAKAAAGRGGGEKTIKRADYFKLPPAEQHKRVKEGWKVID